MVPYVRKPSNQHRSLKGILLTSRFEKPSESGAKAMGKKTFCGEYSPNPKPLTLNCILETLNPKIQQFSTS